MVVLSKEQDLEAFLDILRPFGKPLLFGSQVIGTHLAGSDTDISLIVVKKGEVHDMSVPEMKEFMSRLKQNGKVVFISKAKIPVIHVTYRSSLFDVVINESGGVLSSWLLEDMLKSNEKAMNVVLTIKQWAVGNSLIRQTKLTCNHSVHCALSHGDGDDGSCSSERGPRQPHAPVDQARDASACALLGKPARSSRQFMVDGQSSSSQTSFPARSPQDGAKSIGKSRHGSQTTGSADSFLDHSSSN